MYRKFSKRKYTLKNDDLRGVWLCVFGRVGGGGVGGGVGGEELLPYERDGIFVV